MFGGSGGSETLDLNPKIICSHFKSAQQRVAFLLWNRCVFKYLEQKGQPERSITSQENQSLDEKCLTFISFWRKKWKKKEGYRTSPLTTNNRSNSFEFSDTNWRSHASFCLSTAWRRQPASHSRERRHARTERWRPKKETAVLKEKDADAIAGPGGTFVPVWPPSCTSGCFEWCCGATISRRTASFGFRSCFGRLKWF